MDGGEKVLATVMKQKIGASVKNKWAARAVISGRERLRRGSGGLEELLTESILHFPSFSAQIDFL